jgi:hypothetical protein
MSSNKIHYAQRGVTACGISLFCDCLASYNPQRTTCRNCLKTALHKKALAGIKKRIYDTRNGVQMDLFQEGK